MLRVLGGRVNRLDFIVAVAPTPCDEYPVCRMLRVLEGRVNRLTFIVAVTPTLTTNILFVGCYVSWRVVLIGWIL